MTQKVATAHKMKSRRDSFLRPNCNSDGKADNKRQAFVNTDTRRFKIQTGDMDPPPPAGPLHTSPGGHSHTLPIRVCAAQRGRDFEAPDLERGIHFRGVF